MSLGVVVIASYIEPLLIPHRLCIIAWPFLSAIVAVKMAMDSGSRVVGVVVCEAGGREISVGQFTDDELFSHLGESLTLTSSASF